VTLVYLDDDPVAFHAALANSGDAASVTPAGSETLYAGVLRSIIPWEWNWFDDAEVSQ
jgi:hypothetical protein